MRNFIWSRNIDQKKVVTVAWDTCCKGQNEWGLGIRSLKTFNVASNLHMCWNLCLENKSWSQLLASRVVRNHRAITHSIKSSIWSSCK